MSRQASFTARNAAGKTKADVEKEERGLEAEAVMGRHVEQRESHFQSQQVAALSLILSSAAEIGLQRRANGLVGARGRGGDQQERSGGRRIVIPCIAHNRL